MNLDERKKYNALLKKYERRGALKFQKVVFKVEKLKFSLLKRFFPNFITQYEKYCDNEMKKALKKGKTQDEKNAIKRKYKIQKMEMRKEFYQEKNRNYHMSKNNPTEIVHYLEWNKKVHMDGLKRNAVLLPTFVLGYILVSPLFIPLAVIQLISAGINYECINIQNYNLCRCKIMEDYLEKVEERNKKRRQSQYGEASKLLHECLEENDELPSIDQILAKANSREQLEQLKKMLLEEAESRKSETAIYKEKKKQEERT